MSDRYLWDGGGRPDPEVERLERLLARYRCPRRPAPVRLPRRAFAAVAAAASIAAALLILHAPPSHWELRMEGARARSLVPGETVATRTGQAEIESGRVGRLRLEPESRLRMVVSRADQERFSLERGAMHAFIWAPPSRFVVDTPSATTIDLGCEYELRVMDDGSGLLTVLHGWVAFQAGSVESFIPAGAVCRTEPRRGPGLPCYEDAPAAFRTAVAAFDASRGREGLDALLAGARPRDALTLWHLLVRTSGPDRERVARRFGELVPEARPAALARADRAALEAAWNALGLGDTEWWRTWKQKW